MKTTILKLLLICILAVICAGGIDKIPDDTPPGGGGGGGTSSCVSGDGTGFVCVCPAGQTCITGRNLECSCV